MNHKCLKFIAFLAIAAGLATFVGAGAFARDMLSVAPSKGSQSITLSVGKGQVVEVGQGVSDVMVANPDIVDVGPIKDTQIYLIGAAMGDTNVMAMDEKGNLLRQISVHVKMDTSKLEETLEKSFPNEKVSVDAIANQLVLTGSVSSADVAARVRDTVGHFVTGQQTIINNLTVSSGQQVMIRVKIVEVARNVLNELGIETDISGVNSGNFSVANTTGDATNASFGLTVEPSFGNGSLIYDTGSTGPIQLMIHALERDGLVNTLAQPNLTAISGENARFLAGGEFPIPSQRDNNGNIVYEYRPFGIALAFRPVVLDKNRINLQVSTEVSEVSNELRLQLPGISVPSFTVRRAETTVEMASGGSLMMAGLINSKTIESMNGLPGIQNVPVLGALTRSESFTRNESELLVMITAYLVEPFANKDAEQDVDTVMRVEPLNRALAESLAVAYGQTVGSYAENRSFGYIME